MAGLTGVPASIACATAGGVAFVVAAALGLEGAAPEFLDEPPQPPKIAAAITHPAADPT
jgi:hypothetical protein